MRQSIDRITCDRCGEVYEYLRAAIIDRYPIVSMESVTEMLKAKGWSCESGGSFTRVDHCPECVKRKGASS